MNGVDAVDLIKQYIIALTNLYGQVPAEVLVDIYNNQNEDQISIDDLDVYFDEDMSQHYVYAYKNHFVHETIMQLLLSIKIPHKREE